MLKKYNSIQYLLATSFFNWLDIKVYTCINLMMSQWLTLKVVSFCILRLIHSNSFPQFFLPFIVLKKRCCSLEFKLWLLNTTYYCLTQQSQEETSSVLPGETFHFASPRVSEWMEVEVHTLFDFPLKISMKITIKSSVLNPSQFSILK